jgi:hypothetical protein
MILAESRENRRCLEAAEADGVAGSDLLSDSRAAARRAEGFVFTTSFPILPLLELLAFVCSLLLRCSPNLDRISTLRTVSVAGVSTATALELTSAECFVFAGALPVRLEVEEAAAFSGVGTAGGTNESSESELEVELITGRDDFTSTLLSFFLLADDCFFSGAVCFMRRMDRFVVPVGVTRPLAVDGLLVTTTVSTTAAGRRLITTIALESVVTATGGAVVVVVVPVVTAVVLAVGLILTGLKWLLLFIGG